MQSDRRIRARPGYTTERFLIGRYPVAEGGAMEVRYVRDGRSGRDHDPPAPLPAGYLEVSGPRGGRSSRMELSEPLTEDVFGALAQELRWLDTPAAPPEAEEVYQAVADALAALGEHAEIEAEDAPAVAPPLHSGQHSSVLDQLIADEDLERVRNSWLAPLVR